MLLLIRYIIIAAVLKFGYSLTKHAEGKVSGNVLVSHESPLKNSVVTLASDSLVVRMVRTDENGHFTFHKVPTGTYRLLIVITGYEKVKTDFFRLTATKPTKDFGNIELQPVRQPIRSLQL
ncbi:MAG: carboxypeptidase regulatory-like domain-containing protein [Pedobacter sp.]|nr:MAG: carboxypeptidase regulatory-like domain-containing protein [Pedobacter sp.]